MRLLSPVHLFIIIIKREHVCMHQESHLRFRQKFKMLFRLNSVFCPAKSPAQKTCLLTTALQTDSVSTGLTFPVCSDMEHHFLALLGQSLKYRTTSQVGYA